MEWWKKESYEKIAVAIVARKATGDIVFYISSEFNEREQYALAGVLFVACKSVESFGFSLPSKLSIFAKRENAVSSDDVLYIGKVSEFINPEKMLKRGLVYMIQKKEGITADSPAFFRHGSAVYVANPHLSDALVRLYLHRPTIERVITWKPDATPSSRAYRALGYRTTKWLVEEKGLSLPELYKEIGKSGFERTMNRHNITFEDVRNVSRNRSM